MAISVLNQLGKMRPAGERYIIPFLIDCLPCAIRRDAGKADRCLFNPIKTHFFLNWHISVYRQIPPVACKHFIV